MRRRKKREARFVLKSNNPNLKGGEKDLDWHTAWQPAVSLVQNLHISPVFRRGGIASVLGHGSFT